MYETEEIQQEAKEEKACQAGSTECRSMGVTNSSACLELIMVLYENGCWKLKVKGSIARQIRVGCHSHPAAAVLGTGAPAPVLQAEVPSSHQGGSTSVGEGASATGKLLDLGDS